MLIIYIANYIWNIMESILLHIIIIIYQFIILL